MPTCLKCGGELEQPEHGAQYECTDPDCGAVVAPDQIREK